MRKRNKMRENRESLIYEEEKGGQYGSMATKGRIDEQNNYKVSTHPPTNSKTDDRHSADGNILSRCSATLRSRYDCYSQCRTRRLGALVLIILLKSRKLPKSRVDLWPERLERESIIDEIQAYLENPLATGFPSAAASGWVKRAYLHLGRNPDDNRDKRLLAVVNPVSGQAQSKRFYHDIFEPVLKEMGFSSFDVRETRFVGHGREIVQNYDLGDIDAIVIVGGDGTYSEVYHGLKFHESGEDRLNFPVAILPGGGSWIFSQIDEYIEPLHPASDRDIISAALRVAAWKISWSSKLSLRTTERRRIF